MGSNNLIVIDAVGARAGLAQTIAVGEGPTGVVLDEARGQLYVLDKFEGALSVVSTVTEIETARIRFFDPSPAAIKLGRKHLYDTHKNSGLGQDRVRQLPRRRAPRPPGLGPGRSRGHDEGRRGPETWPRTSPGCRAASRTSTR
jgi:hypothetical protein